MLDVEREVKDERAQGLVQLRELYEVAEVEVDVVLLLPGLAGVLLEVLGEGLELEEEAPLLEKCDRVLLAHELERRVLLVSQVGHLGTGAHYRYGRVSSHRASIDTKNAPARRRPGAIKARCAFWSRTVCPILLAR